MGSRQPPVCIMCACNWRAGLLSDQLPLARVCLSVCLSVRHASLSSIFHSAGPLVCVLDGARQGVGRPRPDTPSSQSLSRSLTLTPTHTRAHTQLQRARRGGCAIDTSNYCHRDAISLTLKKLLVVTHLIYLNKLQSRVNTYKSVYINISSAFHTSFTDHIV